jgi:AraC family transcriptional regulator
MCDLTILPTPLFLTKWSVLIFARSRLENTRLTKFGEFHFSHNDGSPPLTLMTKHPPGESGVALLRMRFHRGVHFNATTRQHLIFFQLSPQMRIKCRMADRALLHEPGAGSLAICPAGIDCSAESDSGFDALVVAIKPSQLALAAAEDSALEAKLHERLTGYDHELLAIGRALARENAENYPNGPLFWSEASYDFMSRLVFGHTQLPDEEARGRLGQRAMQRIRNYILAHLGEPIEVGKLADLANRSAFHFSRVFTRSVGMTPHRYVVHLRLQAAIARIRERQTCLAGIAADTGFADQSHLSRWVRRVHGIALSEIV